MTLETAVSVPQEEDTASLTRRLAAIEAQADALRKALDARAKSGFERVKDFAAFAALLISITTGVFTVWNTVSREPAREARARIDEFQAVVRQLSELDSNLAQKLGAARTENEKATLVGMASGARASLLSRGLALLPVVGAAASFSDHLALGFAAVAMWKYEDAATCASAALQSAKGPTERAMALKLLARANFGRATPASIAAAESNVNQAIALLETDGAEPGTPQMLADLRGAYVLWEAQAGRCNLVEPLFRSFQEELGNGKLSPSEIEMLRKLIGEQYRMYARCPVPPGL